MAISRSARITVDGLSLMGRSGTEGGFKDNGHVPEAAGRSGAARSRHPGLAQRSQARAHLFCEEVRLLPGGEVPAHRQSVVVDEVGICLLRPTPRHLIELVRKDA